MSTKLHEGGVYRHYKNDRKYIVEHLADNPNGEGVIVVYREYGNPYFTSQQRYWRKYCEFGEKFEEAN